MTLFKPQKIKIDSKDMDSYFKGLWWLTKQSMTLFKSQKSFKRWHSKKVSWVALLATTLGPRNYIWATWAQKTHPAISPEPWLKFSQTGPHFCKNHEINPIKLWNLKEWLDLGAWGLQTTSEPLGPWRRIQP